MTTPNTLPFTIFHDDVANAPQSQHKCHLGRKKGGEDAMDACDWPGKENVDPISGEWARGVSTHFLSPMILSTHNRGILTPVRVPQRAKDRENDAALSPMQSLR
eukprot:CAMPEP_0117446450 /NCGR_PEP_ID=MMETSP0759-20121206/6347_1 /TAXON_ID=63605 /ORGANISM="Percolomonas cosmopolitus, Strain WS" /LENGTH=103 /DNA_ID=CAMNT_0005238717 /DNA_START=36 /DNA_END=347 /DNA_ORIENTATION=-